MGRACVRQRECLWLGGGEVKRQVGAEAVVRLHRALHVYLVVELLNTGAGRNHREARRRLWGITTRTPGHGHERLHYTRITNNGCRARPRLSLPSLPRAALLSHW